MAHWKNVAISVNFWAISESLTDLRPASDSGSDKHLKTSLASIFPTREIFPWDRYTIFSSSFQLLLLNFVAHCQFIIWVIKRQGYWNWQIESTVHLKLESLRKLVYIFSHTNTLIKHFTIQYQSKMHTKSIVFTLFFFLTECNIKR